MCRKLNALIEADWDLRQLIAARCGRERTEKALRCRLFGLRIQSTLGIAVGNFVGTTGIRFRGCNKVSMRWMSMRRYGNNVTGPKLPGTVGLGSLGCYPLDGGCTS